MKNTILSKFTCTEDAIAFGKIATRDDLVMLQSLREELGKVVKHLMKLTLEHPEDIKSLDQAISMGTQAQLCREAIEASSF